MLYPVRKQQKFLRTFVKPISAGTFLCASIKCFLRNSALCWWIFTFCAQSPKFTLWPCSLSANPNVEHKSKMGKFAFQESMWVRENLEPSSAWNCCTQTCSADCLGHPSDLSSFLREQMGKHFLPEKRVPKPLDYTACSFYRSRLLGRSGKWLLGSGGRKFTFFLILLTALAVWIFVLEPGKYSRYLCCRGGQE